MRRFVLLTALPALWIAVAAPSPAQDCASCVTQSDAIYFYERHAFGGRAGVFMDCSAFNSCHSDWQPLDCFERHYACRTVMLPREVDAVLAAAEAGDERAIEAAHARHPAALRYDPARGTLQVLGCGGEVTAQVPLRQAPSFTD